MMNKKNLICAILIIFIICLYYYEKENDSSDNQSINLEKFPIYQSQDMTTKVYDLSGQIVYQIKSTKVKHFDNSDDTEFELPDVLLYDRQNSATWSIKAKRAILTNDKFIYLHQDVELNNLTPNAQLQQVMTDNAVVDLKLQLVHSQDAVMIKGEGFYSTGTGLEGDLREKTAKVLENVKTYYNSQEK